MPALLAALKYWKLVGIALLVLAIGVQTIRLSGAERRADKLRFELNEARAALEDAHAKTLKAQKEADRLIQQARERNKSADDKASQIERVVLPGSCKTPRAVMELDI
jgi:flagellar biosynthesis/type III secretory pathway M-ring protein FliF/YscJ